MSKKRLTDINIWDKTWFMDLCPAEKCAFIFIKDKCDNVGIWDVNIKLAETYIGKKIDWKKLINKTNGNIKILNDMKWQLIDFCNFQYGELKENNINNKPHQSYIALLKKHRLWQDYKKTIESLKEKDKATDKDKDKDIVKKK